jgi:hypothetical protein
MGFCWEFSELRRLYVFGFFFFQKVATPRDVKKTVTLCGPPEQLERGDPTVDELANQLQ